MDDCWSSLPLSGRIKLCAEDQARRTCYRAIARSFWRDRDLRVIEKGTS